MSKNTIAISINSLLNKAFKYGMINMMIFIVEKNTWMKIHPENIF